MRITIALMVLMFGSIACADLPLYPAEKHLIELTNRERVRHGLPPYIVDDTCQMAARTSAWRQAKAGNMAHGYSGHSGLGENVAMRSGDDYPGVISQWLNSSGHRAAFLSRSNRCFGVSVFRGRNGGVYATQCFTSRAPVKVEVKVKLKDVYDQVAAQADTGKQKIDVSITSRVLASFFDVLQQYSPAQVSQIVADGLTRSEKRNK